MQPNVSERERIVFFLTHQVVPESFHHLPNIPILQSLSDLQVVVVGSAANLAWGQRGSGVAHGGVVVVVVLVVVVLVVVLVVVMVRV